MGAWLRRIVVSVGIGGMSYLIMLGIMVLSVVYDRELEPVVTYAFDTGRGIITALDKLVSGSHWGQVAVNHLRERVNMTHVVLSIPAIIVATIIFGIPFNRLLGGTRTALQRISIDILPVFKNPANKHRAISLTAEQFRFAFGNAIPEAESDELFEKWAIPAPGKPLFEAAAANFNPHSPAKVATDNQGRGPLLLIMGGKDHTVPEAVTRSTLKQYRHSEATTDILEFPDRAHSLTIDHGWREVADACLTWLDGQGL